MNSVINFARSHQACNFIQARADPLKCLHIVQSDLRATCDCSPISNVAKGKGGCSQTCRHNLTPIQTKDTTAGLTLTAMSPILANSSIFCKIPLTLPRVMMWAPVGPLLSLLVHVSPICRTDLISFSKFSTSPGLKSVKSFRCLSFNVASAFSQQVGSDISPLIVGT